MQKPTKFELMRKGRERGKLVAAQREDERLMRVYFGDEPPRNGAELNRAVNAWSHSYAKLVPAPSWFAKKFLKDAA